MLLCIRLHLCFYENDCSFTFAQEIIPILDFGYKIIAKDVILIFWQK